MLMAMILGYLRLHGRLPLPGMFLLIALIIFPLNSCVKAQQSPAQSPEIGAAPATLQGFTRFEATPSKASKQLPNDVEETSGLIWFRGSWWTHNDSGGKPEIYRLSKNGKRIIQTVSLEGVENDDWEDLATDGTSLFIGDFGNNRGGRTNLVIYKVAWKNIPETGDTRVKPLAIRFNWADQTDFSPKAYQHNFDCEALFCANDRLWLFTKNWGNLNSRLYSLPTEPGNYAIAPRYEFDARLRVTGADYEATNKTLALIGYIDFVPTVWLMPQFDPEKPAEGGRLRIDMTSMAGTQAEGICFGPDGKLWFSAEKTRVRRQMIYELNINSFIRPQPVK